MNNERLNILWTNDNVETSLYMVMMYVTNSIKQKWWKNVRVIIWGATAKLVADNCEIQTKIKQAQNLGVEFSACLKCAQELNVVNEIENLGIELKYWGEGLTEIIIRDEKLITI